MKELVSICMATYNPNMTWLQEQLESINSQDYENIELIILDDCSSEENYKKIQEIAQNIVTKYEVEVLKNKENIGSNKTFENLTKMARGKYIAYCDQDDIWHSDKISVLYDEISKNDDILVVFSDMLIIDAKNNIIADSMSKYRKRHTFFDGKDKFKELIYRNCVVGCTMMIRTDVALYAIPFTAHTLHDQYLTLFSSCFGSIKFLDKTLISYRQHNNNQTGVLNKIYEKKDYRIHQIGKFSDRVDEFFINQKMLKNEKFVNEIKIAKLWSNSRIKWWDNMSISAFFNILKLKEYNFKTSMFEIICARMPNFAFKIAIQFIKKRQI